METQPASLDITPTLTLVDDDIKQSIEKDVETTTPKMLENQSTAESQQTPQQSHLRKMFILAILCSAQFFDIFSSVEAVIALPEIGDALHFTTGELSWVVSAYTLTFASFQLLGGRLSDIWHPKPVFLLGYATVGIFSILCAVSVHPIMLLVFRAVQGVGAAFTIPSSIAMIVQYVPEPREQSQALAIFGAFGAVGNSLGFVLGGVLTSRIGWRWVFYLNAILVLPFVLIGFFVIPKPSANGDKKRQLDAFGVGTLTAALILFVYGISDGNESGWATPQILVTLILSVILLVSFFLIERWTKDPAVPPATWTNKNFLPLFIYCLSIYWLLTGSELQLVQIFQDLFGWSALSAALHCIPIGIAGGTSAWLTGAYGHLVPRKILLVSGQVSMLAAAILFTFADSPDKYWKFIFPGMVLALTGLALGYVGSNIAILADVRPGEEGVAGALVNTAFQLGATVGIAILSAVTVAVNKNQPLDALSQFKGYEASFWSLVGLHGLMIVITLLFIKS